MVWKLCQGKIGFKKGLVCSSWSRCSKKTDRSKYFYLFFIVLRIPNIFVWERIWYYKIWDYKTPPSQVWTKWKFRSLSEPDWFLICQFFSFFLRDAPSICPSDDRWQMSDAHFDFLKLQCQQFCMQLINRNLKPRNLDSRADMIIDIRQWKI